MSTAGNKKRLFLNISLTNRLTLFRVTAQPTFLLTVIPSLATARSFACHTTRIARVANFWAESFNLTNSARFRSLAEGGYACTAESIPPVRELFCCNANGQILSAFCSSALDDQAAIFAGHSYQKAVSPFTRNVAWLKCSFHVPYLWNLFFRKRVFTHSTPLLSRYLL
jgi:hypothetical protein